MVGFFDFVLPALNLLAGCPAERCRTHLTVRVAHALTVKGERIQYLPARLIRTPDGLAAVEVPFHGSADLVAGMRADGALILPAGARRVPKGARLAFRPWRSVA
jgi:molybdopterin biosynthesis enzyme